PRNNVVVKLHGVSFSDSPELSTAIVMVDNRSLPGIFINIEITLSIDVTLALFQRGLYMPYPVKLVTRQPLVDMTRLDDLIILQVTINQFVGVIRDVHFLFADQLP